MIYISKLKEYFPIIRERQEIFDEIVNNASLSIQFQRWSKEQQNEFLDFCCGVKGIKLLYDSFFKEIMNPEYAPERLNDFLSLILNKKVNILCTLPNDSTRIADEGSLLIMDIVVQLEDGSIANVEIQKIGYMFPGQRSACYSADLLLRQYKRLRGEKQKKFSYKDIKTVYTIVLFEQSTKEFHTFPNTYLHRFEQHSDSGINLELLQKYIFIPLDIFRKKQHNTIKTKTDAWLTFFTTDIPEEIIHLITDYPEFRPLYEEIYQMCLNTEKVMKMFSKELLELDRNTVQYMIDEMQDTIDSQKDTIDSQKDTIDSQKDTIHDLQDEIAKLKSQLNELHSK